MATFTPVSKSSIGYETADEFAFASADANIGWPVGTIYGIGQTFSVAETSEIGKVSFLLARATGGTGYLTAQIYSLTGTPGTNGKPTGDALGESLQVSETVLPVTSSLAQFQEIEFEFSTPIALSAGDYCVVLVLENQSVTIRVSQDTTSPADGGNGFYGTDVSTWDGSYSSDIPFKVLKISSSSATMTPASKNVESFTTLSKSSVNTTVADGVDISLGNGLLGVGGGDYFGIGQTFQITNAFPLYSAGFWVSNFSNEGNPGTLVAEIYEVTGTVGTNAVPTGSAVLVSEAVSQADIPNGNVLAEVTETEFLFSNVPILDAGDYALILRLDSIVFPVGVARKTSGSVHYGNGLAKLDGDWLASSTVDYVCALNEFESNSAEVSEASKNLETFTGLSKNAETFTALTKN